MNYFKNYTNSIHHSISSIEVSDFSDTCLSPQAGFEKLCEYSSLVKSINGQQIFIGNGASSSFSQHMALDWSKNGGVRSSSLDSACMITALSNDLAFEDCYLEFIKIFCGNNDLLVAISSSGNSKNIIKAIEYARSISMKVVTFTGLKEKNEARTLGDLNFYIPAKTYGIVECAHQVLLHLWIDMHMGVQEWNRDIYQDMNEENFQV